MGWGILPMIQEACPRAHGGGGSQDEKRDS